MSKPPSEAIRFAVYGTPVSIKSKKAKRPWVERVQESAKRSLPESFTVFKNDVALTIYDFPESQPDGDVDNIIKRIQDALNEVVYIDDKMVRRVVAQRFLPSDIANMTELPELVAEALVNDPPFVYIEVRPNPLELAL